MESAQSFSEFSSEGVSQCCGVHAVYLIGLQGEKKRGTEHLCWIE